MRIVLGLLCVGLTACSGSDSDPPTDPVSDGTDETDEDTDLPIELPFEVGVWGLDFIDPEIDLCGYGRLPGQNITLQAGGSAFEVVMGGSAPGPVTFDCTLNEVAYACTAPGELRLEGSFLSRTRFFGDFIDDSCGSTFPFSAETN